MCFDGFFIFMPVLYLDKSYLNEIMSVQEIKCYTSVTDFSQHIKTERQPAILRQYNIGSCLTLWQNPEHLKVIICQIIIFCHKLTQNTITNFVSFTKIYTNCSEIQNTSFASFEFQNNLCKSSSSYFGDTIQGFPG